ncbi:hypothetical protein COLO4_11354 [Corchorus olitorius]|uniref:TF-B3 domain-containing protein n=1 Tax=Corchorus olitorius TaxID=93759 RepID=A0A1R3K4S6_9ROSI|nr:hypothetical protein COLO4_11354 [Corchorus olitorius]
MQPIPQKFLRLYGKLLPSLLKLEVPSGEVWQVELAKDDKWVWLEKGFKEFAKHYSLKSGHFVLFRYERNAHFYVSIFDISATEIEYPYVSNKEDAASKSDMPCSQPHKKSPNTSGTRIDSKSKASAPVAKGRGATAQKSPEIEVLKSRRLAGAEKTEALKKANGFTSKNPFVKVVMQPSCLGLDGRVPAGQMVSVNRKQYSV